MLCPVPLTAHRCRVSPFPSPSQYVHTKELAVPPPPPPPLLLHPSYATQEAHWQRATNHVKSPMPNPIVNASK